MRGQAAMEFIATYGWAIMVVLMAIGALVYFGVVDPHMFMPERCIMTPGFSCSDYKLSQWDKSGGIHKPEVTVYLRNDQNTAIVMLADGKEMTCPGCVDGFHQGNAQCWEVNYEDGSKCLKNKDCTISPGETVTLDCNAGDDYSLLFKETGQREIIEYSFDYKFIGKDFIHKAQGEIFARVEPQS